MCRTSAEDRILQGYSYTRAQSPRGFPPGTIRMPASCSPVPSPACSCAASTCAATASWLRASRDGGFRSVTVSPRARGVVHHASFAR